MPYDVAIQDNSEETSVFSTPTDPTVDPTDLELTALYNSVASLSIGSLGDGLLRKAITKDAGTSVPPANKFAQREMKWLITFTSNVTGKKYTRELACPDANELPNNSEKLDITAGAAATFVSAFEAVARIQEGLAYNAVTVTSIVFVGRKS